MEPQDLKTLLEITLGRKVAKDVRRDCDDDPFRAVELLNRRVDALRAPYRQSGAYDDAGYSRASKEIVRLGLVARLVDEMNYEFREDFDVELVRSIA
jgi:hypothetical protein